MKKRGLELIDSQFVAITSNNFPDKNLSISLYFGAECANSDALGIIEPKKCQDWLWKGWGEVSNHLYLALKILRETDRRPFLTDKRRMHI